MGFEAGGGGRSLSIVEFHRDIEQISKKVINLRE